MSRLEVELFDLPPDPDLVCAICQCVIAEPTEASRCRHVFCRLCIGAWLSSGARTCPTCRSTLTEFDLHAALPILCNVIGRLIMKCINQADGCQARITVERLDIHLRDDCLFVVERCQCGRDVMRCNQEEHEQNCTSRMIKCSGICQMMITAADRSTHNCTEALKRAFEDERKQLAELKKKFDEVNTKYKELENRVKGWLRGRNNLTTAANRYGRPATVSGAQAASASGASSHVQIATRDFLVSDDHSADSYSSADDNGNDDGEYTPYTSDDERAAGRPDTPQLPPEQAGTSSGVLDSPASPPFHERLPRAPWTSTRNYRNRMFPPLSHFVTTRASTNAGFVTTLLNSSGSSNRAAGHSSVIRSPLAFSSQHVALYHAPDPRPGRQTVMPVVASEPSHQSTTQAVSAQNTDARSSFRESDEEDSNSERSYVRSLSPVEEEASRGRTRSMSPSLANLSPSSVRSQSVYSERWSPRSVNADSVHSYSLVSSVLSRSRSASPAVDYHDYGGDSPRSRGRDDVSPHDSSPERDDDNSFRQSRARSESSSYSNAESDVPLSARLRSRLSRGTRRSSSPSRSRSPPIESDTAESRQQDSRGRQNGLDSPRGLHNRSRLSASPASESSYSDSSQVSSNSYRQNQHTRRRWLSTSVLSSPSRSGGDENDFRTRSDDHSNRSPRGFDSDEQISNGHRSCDSSVYDRNRSRSRSPYNERSNSVSSEDSDANEQERPQSRSMTPVSPRHSPSRDLDDESCSSSDSANRRRQNPKRPRSRMSSNASQAESGNSSDDGSPRPKRFKRNWIN